MIEVENARVQVGAVAILPGVSFSVSQGEVLAVVGPSGSGKTTLMRCLAGITVPTSGSIRIDGYEISTSSVRKRAAFRRSRLGVVFQEPELLGELSVLENVALPLIFSGRRRDESLELAHRALATVGCSHIVGSRTTEISRGEAQRAALARALTLPGRAVLADEPTASLDGPNTLIVAGLLIDHARAHNAAVVIATHDPEVIALTDRVLDLRPTVVART